MAWQRAVVEVDFINLSDTGASAHLLEYLIGSLDYQYRVIRPMCTSFKMFDAFCFDLLNVDWWIVHVDS